MNTTTATSKSLRIRKFIGVSAITLPLSRSNPSVNSPYLDYINFVPSWGSFTIKNTPITKGIVQQRNVKPIVIIEFKASILEPIEMCCALIKAHMQIIEYDSFIRTICCDQNSEEWIRFLKRAILILYLEIGYSTRRTPLSKGIAASGNTNEPKLFKKKVERNPSLSNLSLWGPSQKGAGRYLS